MDDHLAAAAGGDAHAAREVRDAGAAYIDLLRNHILKEDNVLFMIADQTLGPEQQVALQAAFEAADQRPENAGKDVRYIALADELCQRADQAGAAPTA